jgi:hypothetical protein
MKTANKWLEYERLKKELGSKFLTAKQYNAAIQKILRKLHL